MAKFLSAKDVAYDRPGSVANYYGWNYENILPQAQSLLSGGEADHQSNMRKHVDGFLQRNYGLGYDQIAANPNNNNLSQLVNAVDYAVREEGRKQQTKGGGFLDLLKKAIGPVVGAVALGPVGAGLTSAAVGGAIGGAVQGGVSDGPMGALTGALSGYGVGSGVNWASGKLGLGALNDVNSVIGGPYAARAASGIPAANSGGGLFGAGSNFLKGGGIASGGNNVGILSSIGNFMSSNPWVGDLAGAGLQYLGSKRAQDIQADAANRAFESAQFQPYNISGPLGGATFSGNRATANMSPEAVAQANQLRGLVNQNLAAYNKFNPNNYAENAYQTMSDYVAPQRTAETDAYLSNIYNRGAWGSTTGARDIYSLARARMDEDNRFRMAAQELGASESDRLFNNYMKSVGSYNTALSQPYEFISQGLTGGQYAGSANAAAAQYPWLAARNAGDASAAFWGNLGSIATQAFDNAYQRNQQAVRQPTGSAAWRNYGTFDPWSRGF